MEKSKYLNRRIVYIVMGLTGSGKTTRVTNLIEKSESLGLKSCRIDGDDPAKAELSLIQALKDESIRRIYIDGNNLDKSIRDSYISIASKNKVENVLLVVGKFTKPFAEKCCSYNMRGLTMSDFKIQLQKWGIHYGSVLVDIESVKRLIGSNNVRAMRDTRIIGLKQVDDAYIVYVGIEANGEYTKAYRFKEFLDAQDFYIAACSTEYLVDNKKASILDSGKYE